MNEQCLIYMTMFLNKTCLPIFFTDSLQSNDSVVMSAANDGTQEIAAETEPSCINEAHKS